LKIITIWGLATVIGAVVAAALAAGAFEDAWAFLPAVTVTAAHAVIFGVPAALFFRRQGWTSPWAALAGGFVIGVVPLEVYVLINGVGTWSGWREHIEFTAVLGGFGAGGAFAFWLTLKLFGLVAPRQ
jgi:hypothetical protein